MIELSAAKESEAEVRGAAEEVPRARGAGGQRSGQGHAPRSERHRRAVPGQTGELMTQLNY